MDIRSFKRTDTATIDIKDPLGGETDIKVTVYGRDSKQYRQALVEVGRGSEGLTDVERGAKLLQACIESWECVEEGGKPVAHDSDKALKMLMDEELEWFVAQIHVAIQSRANFFTQPEPS